MIIFFLIKFRCMSSLCPVVDGIIMIIIYKREKPKMLAAAPDLGSPADALISEQPSSLTGSAENLPGSDSATEPDESKTIEK